MYLSAEGVVLGADSTSTMFVAGPGQQPGSEHQYDFAQKVFELGDPGSTVGVTFWGLGSLGDKSHRTLIAEAADAAAEEKSSSLEKVAELLAKMFWQQYSTTFQEQLQRVHELREKQE